jgi:hypothetical protein
MNNPPYLQQNGIIKKFECVTYNDISNYKILKEKGIVYDTIDYIINVKHNNKVGEQFNKIPNCIGFNKDTKYKCFNNILNDIII